MIIRDNQIVSGQKKCDYIKSQGQIVSWKLIFATIHAKVCLQHDVPTIVVVPEGVGSIDEPCEHFLVGYTDKTDELRIAGVATVPIANGDLCVRCCDNFRSDVTVSVRNGTPGGDDGGMIDEGNHHVAAEVICRTDVSADGCNDLSSSVDDKNIVAVGITDGVPDR